MPRETEATAAGGQDTGSPGGGGRCAE